MKKFTIFFKTYLQNGLVYPAEFIGWLLIGMIPLAVLPFVWLATFNGQESIGGFTQTQIITYFVALILVQRLVSADIIFGFSREVSEGTLSFSLTKPFKFYIKLLALTLSAQARNATIAAGLITFIVALFPSYFIKPSSPPLLLYSLIALFLAFWINFLFNFCLGTISFWTLKIRGIFVFVFLSARFLAGQFAPLKILPLWAQKLAFVLPFKYGVAFPLEVYLSPSVNDEVVYGFLVQLLWLVILLLLAKFLWGRGVKRYSAFGG